ncbi:hypothetical protein Ddc_14903 [Ditylenchus destructor]|nr:hypothetical protein Ddc_14903 [Ditylenchus destructor]
MDSHKVSGTEPQPSRLFWESNSSPVPKTSMSDTQSFSSQATSSSRPRRLWQKIASLMKKDQLFPKLDRHQPAHSLWHYFRRQRHPKSGVCRMCGFRTVSELSEMVLAEHLRAKHPTDFCALQTALFLHRLRHLMKNDPHAKIALSFEIQPKDLKEGMGICDHDDVANLRIECHSDDFFETLHLDLEMCQTCQHSTDSVQYLLDNLINELGLSSRRVSLN